MISVLPGGGLAGTRTRIGFHLPSLTITGTAQWVTFSSTPSRIQSANSQQTSLNIAGLLVEARTLANVGSQAIAVIELHAKALDMWDRSAALRMLYDTDDSVKRLLDNLAEAAMYDGQHGLSDRLEANDSNT